MQACMPAHMLYTHIHREGGAERERKRDGEGSSRMLQQGKLLLKSVMT